MSNWTVDPTASRTVEGMICSLAGVCDGARQHDHQGFSGADSDFGHSLAQRAQQGRAFTLKQAQGALKLVNKYRRQLGGAAVVQAFLTRPVFRMEPLDASAPRAQDTPSKSCNNRHLTSRDQTAVFSFRYEPRLVEAVKSIRGEHKGARYRSNWDPASKTWTVPVNSTSIMQIMSVALEWEFEIEERFCAYHQQVKARLEQLAPAAEESRVASSLGYSTGIRVQDGQLIVVCEDASLLAQFDQRLSRV